MTERGLAVYEITQAGQPSVVSPAANTFQSPGF
jgi:hypothetical protein